MLQLRQSHLSPRPVLPATLLRSHPRPGAHGAFGHRCPQQPENERPASHCRAVRRFRQGSESPALASEIFIFMTGVPERAELEFGSSARDFQLFTGLDWHPKVVEKRDRTQVNGSASTQVDFRWVTGAFSLFQSILSWVSGFPGSPVGRRFPVGNHTIPGPWHLGGGSTS